MEDILTNSSKSQSPNIPTTDPTSHITNPTPDSGMKDGNPEDLDSMWLRWKCLNCGYVYEGVQELKKCPKCGNEDPDRFTDVD